MSFLRPYASLSVLGLLATSACSGSVDPIGGGPSATSSSSGLVGSSQGGNGPGVGGQGGGGEGGFGAGGSPTAAGGAGPTSIALFESEVPSGGDGGAGVSGVGGFDPGAGGAPPDGERLLVVIGSSVVSCGDPFAPPCVGDSQTLFVWLPPDKQEVGTYPLAGLQGTYSEWSGEGGQCESGTGTGGAFVEGSLTIVSTDATSLQLDLAGSPFPALDGAHDVSRCTPVAPETGAALAYVPAELPDGSSSSTGQGGDTRFYIHFADHLVSCADPFAPPGPDATFRHYLVIMDPALLVAGETYSFGDPRILVLGNESGPDSAQSTSGNPEPGSIFIREVTSSYVDVVVSDTGLDWVDGEGQIPRCG